ncbi:hypothetical protein [Desulfonatronum thioautotrophicum]|uniref:VgrG-related protein n=1 Tax=Desulfonatronum thioautotrophicum TaxID=617001 RepID=UPI00069BA473|nr:hypothetical protein [Desulfonatronum thioautotrophicum]
MIVNQPWPPMLFPGIQHNPSPLSGHSPESEQRQNVDFLAEMLKMSLNSSAIQSIGDLPQQPRGSSTDPTAQLLSGTSPLMHKSRNATSNKAGMDIPAGTGPGISTGIGPGSVPESISKTISEQIPEALHQTVLGSLAPLLNGIGNPGGAGGLDPLSQLISQVTGSTPNPSTSSLVGSPATLVALLQSAMEREPSSSAPSPANPSTLRRAISAYTPHYSAEGFRQKIDHSTRQELGPGHPGHATPTERLHAGRGTETDSHKSIQPATPLEGQKTAKSTEQSTSASQPGILAARFESANRPDAIGYDRRGGTCYGTYQLSSKMGGLDAFIAFLDTEAPEWAKRLREAGPANTRGRTGAMPTEWKRIHRENPERFAALQHAFTHKTYYEPAAELVHRRTGIDPSQASPALREVLWSTAVQHGVNGAANIFQRSLDTVSAGNQLRESDLIQAIYNERKTRFTGSTQAVRSAVQNRFEQEMQLALGLLPEDRETLV